MKKAIIIFTLILFGSDLFAQKDSVLYVQGFNFNQGIYLTFAQFRSNSPVPKSAILLEEDSTRLDYVKLALSKETVQWKDTSGKIQTTKTSSIWGYSENKGVFIRWNNQFNRVVVIGSLCHFTSNVTNYMYTGPGTYPNQQYGTPVESLQQYVIDIDSAAVYEFNITTMEYLLRRDAVLHQEFVALKKKKKRDQQFIFLRRYNERHSLYFTK